ncbi:hypothetical protein ACWEVD_28695 [Nocardia thailandica]
MYDLIQADARRAVSAALARAAGDDFPGRARAAVRAYAESIGSDPRRARVSFVEVINVGPEVERHRLAQREIWAEFFTDEIKGTLGEGFVPAGGYGTAARGFIGALIALVHQWSEGASRAELEDIVEVLTRFLVSLA